MTTETMENGTDVTTIDTYVTTKETWETASSPWQRLRPLSHHGRPRVARDSKQSVAMH